MLWDIRARMKPALAVIDLIPNIHRTPALAALRRAVLEGRPATGPMSSEDRELAFHDAAVALTSPIGARVLKALYLDGHLKLKTAGIKALPALDAYIATDAAFRADVARILAAEETRRLRLAEIVADPACADPEDLSPFLIDKVMSARFGYGIAGEMEIAGLPCHRTLSQAAGLQSDRLRAEGTLACWWVDALGNRHGDPA